MKKSIIWLVSIVGCVTVLCSACSKGEVNLTSIYNGAEIPQEVKSEISDVILGVQEAIDTQDTWYLTQHANQSLSEKGDLASICKFVHTLEIQTTEPFAEYYVKKNYKDKSIVTTIITSGNAENPYALTVVGAERERFIQLQELKTDHITYIQENRFSKEDGIWKLDSIGIADYSYNEMNEYKFYKMCTELKDADMPIIAKTYSDLLHKLSNKNLLLYHVKSEYEGLKKEIQALSNKGGDPLTSLTVPGFDIRIFDYEGTPSKQGLVFDVHYVTSSPLSQKARLEQEAAAIAVKIKETVPDARTYFDYMIIRAYEKEPKIGETNPTRNSTKVRFTD